MSSYTNEQIRGAILRAAARIKSKPSCYDFYYTKTPDCGTPGCMLGWVGHELGMKAGESIDDVLESMGRKRNSHRDLYFVVKGGLLCDHNDASRFLRAYADRYFPAEKAAVAPVVTAEHEPAQPEFIADLMRQLGRVGKSTPAKQGAM